MTDATTYAGALDSGSGAGRGSGVANVPGTRQSIVGVMAKLAKSKAPLLASLKKGTKPLQQKHTWTMQRLAASGKPAPRAEIHRYVAGKNYLGREVADYVQIYTEAKGVSRSEEAAQVVTKQNTVAKQLANEMFVQTEGQEFKLTDRDASAVDNSGDSPVRTSASLGSWLEVRVSEDTGTVVNNVIEEGVTKTTGLTTTGAGNDNPNGGYNPATQTTRAVRGGTKINLTLDHIGDMHEALFRAGSEPTQIWCDTSQARKIAKLQIANEQRFKIVTDKGIGVLSGKVAMVESAQGAVSAIMSSKNFTTHTTTETNSGDRVQATDIYFVDPRYIEKADYVPWEKVMLSRDSTVTWGSIYNECCFPVLNDQAHGVIRNADPSQSE